MRILIQPMTALLLLCLAPMSKAQFIDLYIRNSGTHPLWAVTLYEHPHLTRYEWRVSGRYRLEPGQRVNITYSRYALVGFFNDRGEEIKFKPSGRTEKIPDDIGPVPVRLDQKFSYAWSSPPQDHPDYAEIEMSLGVRGLRNGEFQFDIAYNGTPGRPLLTNAQRKARARAIEQARQQAEAKTSAESKESAPTTKPDVNASMAYSLGLAALNGIGKVEKDYVAAMSHFKKAASLGHPKARFHIGEMYRQGLGVPRNMVAAVRYYTEAGDDPRAIVAIARLTYNDKMPKALDDDQSAVQRQETALRLFRTAAEMDNAEAQEWVGFMHENGQGTPVDMALAHYWYARAEGNGRAGAAYRLGMMYLEGRGVEASPSRAMHYMSTGAARGNTLAKERLGWMYETGTGVERNLTAARSWYEQAAEAGSEFSKSRLEALPKGG
ncbi:MAG: tetratricopeptide repeat protein [Phycisphaerales bacterium JB037]